MYTVVHTLEENNRRSEKSFLPCAFIDDANKKYYNNIVRQKVWRVGDYSYLWSHVRRVPLCVLWERI